MTQIQFYHLTTTPLERALPKLLEKAYAGKFRTLLLTNSDDRAAMLSDLLWTYNPNSFLPHATTKEGRSEQQPILIATDINTANQPNLLVVTDGRQAQPESFDRILDMFNGSDEQAVANARTRWKNYKEAGHDITYMKQNDAGSWEKAA